MARYKLVPVERYEIPIHQDADSIAGSTGKTPAFGGHTPTDIAIVDT